MGSKLLSSGAFAIILAMYGGGFATVRPISPTCSAPSSLAPFMALPDGVSTAGIIGRVVITFEKRQLAPACARSALQHDHVYPVRDADHRPDLQLPDQAGQREWHMSPEEVAKLQPDGKSSGLDAIGFVRHRQGRPRSPGPRCSGPSSGSRLPGVSGDAGKCGQDSLINRRERAGAWR